MTSDDNNVEQIKSYKELYFQELHEVLSTDFINKINKQNKKQQLDLRDQVAIVDGANFDPQMVGNTSFIPESTNFKVFFFRKSYNLKS